MIKGKPKILILLFLLMSTTLLFAYFLTRKSINNGFDGIYVSLDKTDTFEIKKNGRLYYFLHSYHDETDNRTKKDSHPCYIYASPMTVVSMDSFGHNNAIKNTASGWDAVVERGFLGEIRLMRSPDYYYVKVK